MKKAAMVLTALAFFLPFILSAQDQDEGYYGYSYARLSYVKGDVVVQRAADLGSEQGVVNLALVEGDKLETSNGRAEVYFGKKNYLRLDDNTEVEFANLPRQGDDRIRVHLLAGKIYLRVGYLEQEKNFEVHTPDASFYILEEGLYRIDLRGNGESELTVLEGSVEAAGEEGSELVGSRARLLASNGHLGSQTSLSYNRDDFDYWNENRDSLQNQYVSKRYLSSELADYEYELASNGDWAYERPYGYVWVPHVYYQDWRPYYYGRWLWYPSCGWSWVSDESWGWCTYHYGRWHWRMGLGWYWIPTYHWGPAWVHWYNGYDYVGWCPLSWYNRPVVIVNNYFYDRYYGSHYPAASRALTVVHRGQLQAPRVSGVALNHVEASRLGHISLQSRQPDIKPAVSRSGLRASPSSKALSPSEIRPSGKSLGASGAITPSRTVTNSPQAKSPLSPSQSPAGSSPRLTSRSQTGNRGVAAYPSLKKSEPQSVRPSTGTILSAPRSIKSYSGTLEKTPSSSSRSGIKSYSSSPRVSPSERRPSLERRESPRVYSPNASISRFGSSGLISPKVSLRGALASRSPSLPRGESYSGRSSFSSPPRSIFSAPRESSSSRSSGFSAPSFSRPAPSRSSASSRSSAPRSSSPSHSSAGRVVKKGN